MRAQSSSARSTTLFADVRGAVEPAAPRRPVGSPTIRSVACVPWDLEADADRGRDRTAGARSSFLGGTTGGADRPHHTRERAHIRGPGAAQGVLELGLQHEQGRFTLRAAPRRRRSPSSASSWSGRTLSGERTISASSCSSSISARTRSSLALTRGHVTTFTHQAVPRRRRSSWAVLPGDDRGWRASPASISAFDLVAGTQVELGRILAEAGHAGHGAGRDDVARAVALRASGGRPGAGPT